MIFVSCIIERVPTNVYNHLTLSEHDNMFVNRFPCRESAKYISFVEKIQNYILGAYGFQHHQISEMCGSNRPFPCWSFDLIVGVRAKLYTPPWEKSRRYSHHWWHNLVYTVEDWEAKHAGFGDTKPHRSQSKGWRCQSHSHLG